MDKDQKPECRLVGTDGNVFAIIGLVSRTLRKAKQPEKAAEFKKLALSGEFDYDQILGDLVHRYVDVS